MKARKQFNVIAGHGLPISATCDAFLCAIYRDHPELREETAYFPGQGDLAYTVFIGDLVFKSPRFDNIRGKDKERGLQQRREAFAREFKVIDHLHDAGLPMTQAVGHGDDPAYYCMRRNTGIQLDPDDVDKMTAGEKRQIAKDLAGFMVGFAKAISAEDAKKLNFPDNALSPEYPPSAELKDFLASPAVAEVFEDNLSFCRQVIAGYEAACRDQPMVASHGDLHSGNILYDPKTKRIDGKIGAVIDFGLCRYLHPAKDCYQLCQDYKDDFISMLCDEYSKTSDRKLTLKDVKIHSCAIRISQVKDCLESKDREMWNRIPKLLELIASMKEDLAEPVAELKKTPAKKHDL